MDNDLLSSSSVDLSLSSHGAEQSSDVVGLHVLTTDSITGSSDSLLPGMTTDECGQAVIAVPTLISSDAVPTSVMEKDGEITLNSSFIPENAILMETPRGLMLTVPENIAGLTFSEVTSPSDSAPRQLLSCIPVPLFSSCDTTVDVDGSTYTDMNLKNELHDESEMSSHLQVDGSNMSEELQHGAEEATQITNSMVSVVADSSLPLTEETSEVCVSTATKRKGGWPKGRRRKKPPLVSGPRAPLTGYVLYAVDRRKEIKRSHPEISFPEVTKILGQEWSSLEPEVKEKYLAAAEADKKRYREELKAFRSSETYQESVRKKLMRENDGTISTNSENSNLISSMDDDEENSNELHCKVCNVYFSTLHNKREHMYGRTHIQAVTDAMEKELIRQQQEEQSLMDGALVVSEEPSQDGFPMSLQNSSSEADEACASTSGCSSSGPVDIHGFMMEFIHKNYEREQEISVLKKCLNKALQDNVAMCKEIQVLQEYQTKLEEEIRTFSATTSSLIVQNDALKMVPTLFGIINL